MNDRERQTVAAALQYWNDMEMSRLVEESMTSEEANDAAGRYRPFFDAHYPLNGDEIAALVERTLKGDNFSQFGYEISGGYISFPDHDDGTIRRVDDDGNTMEIRRWGDENYDEWAELFVNYPAFVALRIARTIEAVQLRYSKQGASDTEPDYQIHQIMRLAADGHPYDDSIRFDLYWSGADAEMQEACEQGNTELHNACRFAHGEIERMRSSIPASEFADFRNSLAETFDRVDWGVNIATD